MPELIIRLFPRWRRWRTATPACGFTTNWAQRTSCGRLRASALFSLCQLSTTSDSVSPIYLLRWSWKCCSACCISRAGLWTRWGWGYTAAQSQTPHCITFLSALARVFEALRSTGVVHFIGNSDAFVIGHGFREIALARCKSWYLVCNKNGWYKNSFLWCRKGRRS